MPLVEWLNTTSSDTVNYFQRCVHLFSLLVEGRNKHTTALVKEMLPYDLVLAIATDPDLSDDEHLCRVSAQFVGLIRLVYVDNEPNEVIAYVITM